MIFLNIYKICDLFFYNLLNVDEIINFFSKKIIQ